MGLYGPLVLYQVVDNKRATAERELEELKDFGRSLRARPNLLQDVNFGSDYTGPQSSYVHCDSSGNKTVFPEKINNYKFELIQTFNEIGRKKLSVAVNDYNKFIDGDPLISAAICYLNENHVLQIFSLRAPAIGQLKDQSINGNIVRSKSNDEGVYHHLDDNSRYCQKRSEYYFKRLVKELDSGYPELQIDWEGDLFSNVAKIFKFWNILASDEMERLEMERLKRDGTAREMIRI